jgi:two-component system sensor histidine kinase HydH
LRRVAGCAQDPTVEDLRPRTTLFCAVIAFAIALSMLLRGRKAVHWLFAAFATDVAFWYGSQSLADLFKDATWVRVTAVVTVLLPQFAVHLFESVVPPADKEHRSRLPRIATIVGVPMLALELSPYNDTSVSLGLAYVYVFGLLAAALISLARRGQQNPSRAVRDRVRFLFVVGVLATTFTLADFVSFLGGPVRHLPPIGAVLATVFLFVLAESLTRPRLADLYEMAGRLLVSTALAFCLAGIFYVFVKYVGRFNTYLNAVLAAIVILVLFEPLQTEVETRIHQFFFRERYDLETTVTELRRRLAHVLEIDEMVETLLGGLERSRRATSVAIFLRDQDGDGFDLVGSIGAAPPNRLEALATRPLLERLQTHVAISLEEVARERKETDSALLTSSAALGPLQGSVLLGVKADDEELVGLICVADDRVRDAFTPEEITLLETVASQIGVAIANSRVYSRMKERDRLAALGAMAAGLAHEVKNPLGAIKGAAQLLEELDGAVQADHSSRDFIGIILEEVNRLDRVVGSFLDYARPHAGNPIPLDINAAVKRTLQILSSQRTDDEIDVKLELAEPLARVKIDPEQFRQVLINLMQNAIQAMDGRGRVTVSTSLRRLTRTPWTSGTQGERGTTPRDGGSSPSMARRSQTDEAVEVVEVSVKDTGPGISQKVKNYLFIPFFTTKEQGTGLGLAISQSIVQNAGGTIDVQSQSGAGTTFTIVLPSAGDTLSTPAPPEVAPRANILPSGPA